VLQGLYIMVKNLNVRDDFRRDGLAASFLVDKDIYETYVNAFPDGTRFNIGYPSICSEEYNTCDRILKIADGLANSELCIVGHAREPDLQLMSRLLSNRKNVSANVWIPASKEATKNILGQTTDEAYQIAKKAIDYWRKITTQPLDIALTDVTAKEDGIDERVIEWHNKLKLSGYRSIILCDTKGIGDEGRLRNIFANVSDFEWHPHNDNMKALLTSEISAQYGATYIGTSYLSFSERMNMLDPRQLIQDKMNLDQLDRFYHELCDLLGEDPSGLANEIYNKETATTGTHFKLWNSSEGKRMFFGVTSDSALFSSMTGLTISAKQLSLLKDECLYRMKMKFISKDQIGKLVTSVLQNEITQEQTLL